MNLPHMILLDRDGVINENLPHGVRNIQEFKFIDGSLQALKLIQDFKIPMAIITNQGGVGRGIITEEGLNQIHVYMIDEFQKEGIFLNTIYACMDHPDHPTIRRKPAPGMLLEAMEKQGVQPSDTLMIGDDIRDMEAAYRANCGRHLVLTGRGKEALVSSKLQKFSFVQIHKNLYEAVRAILDVT